MAWASYSHRGGDENVVRPHISPELRKQVAQDGGYRCGYCLTSQRIIGRPMAIDHILPISKGGTSTRDNLWLSCRRCNEFKGRQTHAVDPLTDTLTPLFNPRANSWNVHFAWDEGGAHIIGLTAIGRGTVLALRLNNDEIVTARHLWAQAGWHPPVE